MESEVESLPPLTTVGCMQSIDPIINFINRIKAIELAALEAQIDN
jgi:hypothetical protein